MIIAIDIGGSKVSAALFDGADIVDRRSAPSPVHTRLTQLVPMLSSLIEDWLGQAAGVGVACTGLVNERGEVHFLSTGTSQRLPLEHELVAACGLPVTVLNDAWAAAWGEYCLGGHSVLDTLVYITVSTGIGGGIVQNGKLLTSTHGFAAQIGHLTVPRVQGENIQCICGRWNCVEAIASGTAIGCRASKLLGREIGCREAFAAQAEHPRLAILFDESASAVAELIANVRVLTGTDLVVMGGGVGLQQEFRRRVVSALAKLPELYQLDIATPTLAKDADLYGAALMIKEYLNAAVS